MKISEMTNEQAADAMVKLAQPMANLLEDKETMRLLEEMQNPNAEGGISYFAWVIPKIVPFLMKDHKSDVYAIVAALTMKPISAVGKMNFMETVKELRESIDEDFLTFFKSSGSATA